MRNRLGAIDTRLGLERANGSKLDADLLTGQENELLRQFFWRGDIPETELEAVLPGMAFPAALSLSPESYRRRLTLETSCAKSPIACAAACATRVSAVPLTLASVSHGRW